MASCTTASSPSRVLVVVAENDPRGHDRARLGEQLGGLKERAVELERRHGEVRVEVVGEDERQAEGGGDPRPAVGRAEHPQLGHRVLACDRAHGAVTAAEMAAQLGELLLEIVRRGAAQRHRRALVGPRRAAQAEVDPPGMQRLEHAEALGDRQRRVVWQHHAARADADALRVRREVRDQDLRGRRGHRRDVVVLGDPEAPEAQLLGVAGESCRARQRGAGGAPGGDRREVEDGQDGGHDSQPRPAGRRG
jgi:hypothetical protein